MLGCFLIVEFLRLLRHRRDCSIVKQIVVDSLIVCGSFILLWIANSSLFPSGGNSYLAQYASMSIETVRNLSAAYFNAFGLFFGEASRLEIFILFPGSFLSDRSLGTVERRAFFSPFLWPVDDAPCRLALLAGTTFHFSPFADFHLFYISGDEISSPGLPEKYPRTGGWVVYGFWSLMALFFLFTSSLNAFTNLQHDRAINGPFDPYSNEVYKYIKEETPPASVVIFFKPRVMRLMTGRDTIMSTECDRILKGDYLVLSRKVGKNQQIPPEEIAACNLPLNQVLTNRQVYRL